MLGVSGMSEPGWLSQLKDWSQWEGRLREEQAINQSSRQLSASALPSAVFSSSTLKAPGGWGVGRGEPGLQLLFPGCRKGSPNSSWALARRQGSGSKVRRRKAWASADRELGTGGCTLYMPTCGGETDRIKPRLDVFVWLHPPSRGYTPEELT